jgi:serine/threonine protein kinase
VLLTHRCNFAIYVTSFVFRYCRAYNNLDGTTVTVKKLRLDDGQEEGLAATAVREMSLLRELSSCPNIVRLLDVLYDRARAYLIMEHLDMDLHKYLQKNQMPRPSCFIRFTIYQILNGLQAAHARRVIHRDLKPQNILIDAATGVVKLADFGLSRTFFPAGCGRRTMTKTVVTLLYRAPEVLLGCRRYSEAVDMWSAGCVLAELALGAPLFAGDSEIGQLFQIFQLLGTPDEDAWPGVTNLPEWHPLFPKWVVPEGGLSSRIQGRLCPYALQLLEDLLQLDPLKRPTASQALAHPYFDPLRGG